jgi:hypothetical protein
MSSRYDELERLQRLRESGALSEEEFQVEKRRLLGHGAETGTGFPRAGAVEIVDEDAARSRNALLIVLGVIGLLVAIAIGAFVGHGIMGGRAAPEANVALPQNEDAADENLIAPPPPTDVRTMPVQEQLARAFEAAFSAKDQALRQIGARTFVYHPAKLIWDGDRAILISPATAGGDCQDCAGTIAVHYLTAAADQFQVTSSWPEAVGGGQWIGTPGWRVSYAFTAHPAIWQDGRTGNEDCGLATATLTELTPAGPIQSGPIRLSYHNKGGLSGLVFGDTTIRGHITNIQKDVSFDVIYSGDKQFTETWVKQGDRFVPQGGETKMPQCGS